MMRCVQTLSLVLLSALAATAPPSTPGRCSSCRYGADIVGTVAIPDASEAWLDMAQGANLDTGDTAMEQQSTGRRSSTATNHLLEDGDATADESKAMGANLRAESVNWKLFSGALLRRGAATAGSSETVNVSKPSHPLRRRPPNDVLLARKRVVRAVTNEGRIALSVGLHAAVLIGRIEEIRQLIGQGADVGFKNGDGYTALHWAAASDQLEALRLLIDSGANVNMANNYGTTPLHIASSKNSVKCVVALLGARAIVGARDQWGWTPLHAAANYDHAGVVQTLLWAGADPNVRDREGNTAKDLAHSVAVLELFPTFTRATAPSVATSPPTHPSASATTRVPTLTQTSTISQMPPSREMTQEERRTLSEQLVEAADKGRTEEMRELIVKGADVRSRDSFNNTGLHYAAREGHVDALRLLVDKGAVVDAANLYGRTPLHYASWNEQTQSLEALVAAGADLNAQEKEGYTSLHDAASQSKEGAVRALLKLGANPSIRDKDGKTARDVATSDAVRALLPAPADASTTTTIPTPTDEERMMLSEKLLEAAEKGRTEEMRELIAKGADVHHRNARKTTALHFAARDGHVDALRLLLDRGAFIDASTDEGTALHYAAWNGRPQSIEALAAAGADLNARESKGNTPLHDAAARNQEGTVQALLNLGANPSIRNKEGKKPRDVTSSDAVRALLSSTADATTPRSTVRTPTEQERRTLSEKLLEAAEQGRVEDMKQLIGQGADVAYKNKDGITPLHKAAKEVHIGALRVLLDRGAPVDATTNSGTPLHWAAWNGRTQIVEALAAAGADLNARDIDGDTPLHDAASQSKEGTVRALLALGADASVRNNGGKTARDIAKTDAVRTLLPPAADVTTPSPAAAAAQERKVLSQKLVDAARHGRLDEMRQLIGKGADVRSKEVTNGETALHYAAQNCHMEALRLLLAGGATVDATTTNHGSTPLLWAAERGKTQCVQALAAAGANLNAPNNYGWTPLGYATHNKHEETVRALLASNPRLRDASKSDVVRALPEKAPHAAGTPVTPADTPPHLSTTATLVALSPSENAQLEKALLDALGNASAEVIRLWNDGGALVNATADTGHTPLHVAPANGDLECMDTEHTEAGTTYHVRNCTKLIEHKVVLTQSRTS